MGGDILGATLKGATFLGAISTCSGISWLGIEARCAASLRGWRCMEKSWAGCQQCMDRKIALRSAVFGAATPGLTGLVLCQAQRDKLGRQRLKIGRVLLDAVAVRMPADDGNGGVHE
eukprot:5806629-Pyramimonas_sp.AAC.1